MPYNMQYASSRRGDQTCVRPLLNANTEDQNNKYQTSKPVEVIHQTNDKVKEKTKIQDSTAEILGN